MNIKYFPDTENDKPLLEEAEWVVYKDANQAIRWFQDGVRFALIQWNRHNVESLVQDLIEDQTVKLNLQQLEVEKAVCEAFNFVHV